MKKKNLGFTFVLCSLIRTFARKIVVVDKS